MHGGNDPYLKVTSAEDPTDGCLRVEIQQVIAAGGGGRRREGRGRREEGRVECRVGDAAGDDLVVVVMVGVGEGVGASAAVHQVGVDGGE